MVDTTHSLLSETLVILMSVEPFWRPRPPPQHFVLALVNLRYCISYECQGFDLFKAMSVENRKSTNVQFLKLGMYCLTVDTPHSFLS
jgi:hypothetical protein